RKRPCGDRAQKGRNEFPPPHWIFPRPRATHATTLQNEGCVVHHSKIARPMSPMGSAAEVCRRQGRGPVPVLSQPAACAPTRTLVKGFGYRPVDDLSAGAEGRCPKASKEGTRGGLAGGLPSMGI